MIALLLLLMSEPSPPPPAQCDIIEVNSVIDLSGRFRFTQVLFRSYESETGRCEVQHYILLGRGENRYKVIRGRCFVRAGKTVVGHTVTYTTTNFDPEVYEQAGWPVGRRRFRWD